MALHLPAPSCSESPYILHRSFFSSTLPLKCSNQEKAKKSITNWLPCNQEHTIPQNKPCLQSNGEHTLLSVPVPGNWFVTRPLELLPTDLAPCRIDLFPYPFLLSRMSPTAVMGKEHFPLPSPAPQRGHRDEAEKLNATYTTMLPSLI